MTPEELFDQAAEMHRTGNMAEAEALYKQLLAVRPDHHEALNLLGIIALQSGRTAMGAQALARAAALSPAMADYHLNYGAALDQLGKLDAAVAEYSMALNLRADYPQALSNLGNALRRQGKLEEAISLCRRALELQPGLPDASNNLGLALAAAGQMKEAIEAHTMAVALRQNSAEFFYNLGMALQRGGRVADAVMVYRKSASLAPPEPGAWNSEGQLHNNFGSALLSLGDHEAAIQEFRKAIEVRPDYAFAYNNLGTALHAAGELRGAEAAYRKAVEMAPEFQLARNNLGKALKIQGRFDEAVGQFRQAIATDEKDADAHLDLGFLLLMEGKLLDGYREFEWRLRGPAKILHGEFKQKRWEGEELAGKTLLVYAEEGFGETIQYARFVPLLKGMAGRLIFECQGELIPLFGKLSGADEIVASGGTLPEFDVQVPLSSLPHLFKTELASIPNAAPYVTVPEDRLKRWSELVGSSHELKVGLVWSGNRSDRMDKRSIGLSALAPLAAVAGVKFFSLQMGEDGKKARLAGMELVDYTAEIGDFGDTGALVEQMDLVISIDTAVAHLAGALGKTVWLLAPFVPAYQWMLARKDSPWYPTMRIFRQPGVDAWGPAISEVAGALAEKDRVKLA